MKKFTFMMIALLCAMVTFAAVPKKQFFKAELVKERTLSVKPIDRKAQPKRNVRRAAAELVTPPSTATVETFYTVGGKFYVSAESGWADGTSLMPTVSVAIDGKDMYIQGLAYWFKDSWIKGTIDEATVTFANGQFIGEDEYGFEYIVGSEDGETLSDIVFEYDSKAGVLTAVTPFIAESGAAEELKPYCYWYMPVFSLTEPEGPEVIVAPEDLVTEEYSLTARNYDNDKDVSGVVQIGFDGKDVYMQGLCTWLPEAWVKGTLDGKTITFATGQYFGNYADEYDMFLNVLMGADVVFDYDAEAGTLTAQNEFFLVDNNQYYFDSYRGCVIKKVVEKAAMPANPAISNLENSDYGWRFYFNVPTVDVNGDGLVTSKLSYMIYTDTEGKIAPLTFTPATQQELTEDMTEIPYGFTDGWDIYSDRIYLNGLYSADWNNLGIQSIYYGGGETNATEIQWYHIKDYAAPTDGDFTFNFNEMDLPTSNSAGVTDGDINKDKTITEGSVSLTISPKEESATSPNRFWSTSSGPQLRVYSGTLTFEVPEGAVITQIVFNHNGKWGENTADTGKITNDAEVKAATWEGEAQKVVVTIAANSQINSIVVTVKGGDEPGPGPEDPEEEAIDPDGKTYTFDDSTMEGWTTIDADGDGYNWVLGSAVADIYLNGSNLEGNGHNSSADCVVSGSYSNVAGALTPDNYLVSPKVKLGSTFSFFAVAQDASYPEEHFGVFVSTKGKSAADFEKVEEWTLSAARVSAPRRAQGLWYQYIVDMSAYEGEEGYVAIRHFNCTDQFLMLVDDITFGTPADPDPVPELVELPEGVKPETWTLEGVYGGNDLQLSTGVAFDGNDIYVQGLAYYFPEAWVKGTITDGIATFPTGQFVGRDSYGSEYLVGVDVIEGEDDDEQVISDIKYEYDAKARTLTQLTAFVVENDGPAEEMAEIKDWGYWVYSRFFDGEPVELEPVEAPEGLETEPYFFKATVSKETEDEDGETVIEFITYTNEVKVGFDGNDLYIQGISEDYPEGWVKATKNEAGQYVIPANQYMGALVIESDLGAYEYPFHFGAIDDYFEFADAVLDYNAETNTFSTDQMLVLNGSRFILNPYQTFDEVTITKIVEMAGTPANPSFTGYALEDAKYPYVAFDIPIVDTDGNPMVNSKLFYTVWVEKDGKVMPYTVQAAEYQYVEEDMVEIPYTYDDNYDIHKGGEKFYFNPVDEVAEFTNVGVQSIYYGGGEINASDIVWLDGTVTTGVTTGIKDINTANNTAVYYDLQGRKVTASQKGLLIKQSRQDNGTITTVKVVRK